MSFLPNLTAIGDALGWAVLHSLWQGALAAILVWAFRAITRESAADTRYMFGFLTLIALFATFIGTFIYYFNIGVAMNPTTALPEEPISEILSTALSVNGNPLLNLTNHTSTIGAIWALCFMGLAARYLAAFRLTHKLRTTGTSPLPSNWQTRFVTLAEQSGVNDKVRGFISEHVASPVTFGFFKPVVLVPAWFFTGMSAEQCEAVLLHELAHIRRHDFLTNVFQIIIKTVFFYHPAVQYICKHINTDREHACDDFAVKMTHDPESLATALGTIRIKAARNAGIFAQVGILGADGADAPIMQRLKRLMGVPTHVRTNGTARGFAATGMVIITAGLVLTLGASQSLAHPVSIEELAGKKENKLTITGDGYKVVGNAYYIKGKSGYSLAQQMEDGYSYAFETRNGKTFAIKTDASGRKTLENGETYKPSQIKQKQKEKTNYQYSSLNVDGKKYKIRTNTTKNQTFISINNDWLDLDEADLDVILPTPPLPPIPPVNTRTEPLAPLSPLPPTIYADNTWSSNWEKEQQEAVKEWHTEQKEFAAEQRELRREQEHEHKASAKLIKKMAQKEAKARQKGNSKLARELADDRRELEQEHRELVQEHHEDIREWEQDVREAKLEWKQEQREAKQEWAQEIREAKLERAEEIRDREHELQERKRDNEQSARDERQHERELQQQVREEQQHERELQQQARERQQHEREKQQHINDEKHRKKDKKLQAHYAKMRKHLTPLLIADGFIKSKKQKVIIDIKDETTSINGRTLTSNEHDKYCPIISKYFKREGHTKFIKFKPGYMYVSAKDNEGHSYVYTHTE